jgi:hypothetical protein
MPHTEDPTMNARQRRTHRRRTPQQTVRIAFQGHAYIERGWFAAEVARGLARQFRAHGYHVSVAAAEVTVCCNLAFVVDFGSP